jgi:spermidine dehydrogenase
VQRRDLVVHRRRCDLGANAAPPEAMAAERFKLLTTPFVDDERSLRDDMGRVLGPHGFEFDRDVVAVHLYRWGHGMIYPKVGWMFSAPLERNGGFVRADCARRRAKAPLGRLSFGAQDLEGNPSLECAIAAGLRTSDEALHWL